MIQIENKLLIRYNRALSRNNIPVNEKRYYVKWLRYYLGFCHKYRINHFDEKSVSEFIEKLWSKKQNEPQRQQAKKAIGVYFNLLAQERHEYQPNPNPIGNGNGYIKEWVAHHQVKDKTKVFTGKAERLKEAFNRVMIQGSHGRQSFENYQMRSKYGTILRKH